MNKINPKQTHSGLKKNIVRYCGSNYCLLLIYITHSKCQMTNTILYDFFNWLKKRLPMLRVESGIKFCVCLLCASNNTVLINILYLISFHNQPFLYFRLKQKIYLKKKSIGQPTLFKQQLKFYNSNVIK